MSAFTGSIFDNFGSWDGKTKHFEPTATPLSVEAGRFIYKCQQELESARISLDRVLYSSERAKAFNAQQEQLQGVIDAARDVELAIASVIQQLTGSAPVAELKPVQRPEGFGQDRIIQLGKIGDAA